MTKKQADTQKHINAKASSAHSRINIPLNLENWRHLDKESQAQLLWFHQHILDNKMGWVEVEKAVDYKRDSIFRFLKGLATDDKWKGSYPNFVKAIKRYRKLEEKRMSIQNQEFRHNQMTRLIFSVLDYSSANNCMTLIVGESGMGKSEAMQQWRNDNNHGRSVYVDCPSVGGIKGFLSAIAYEVGVGRNMPVPQLLSAVIRSFNRNRILLLDNMHRALPADPRSVPRAFDIVQQIQEASQCAVGMSATARLDNHMRASGYMFEQILGRIGTPFYLPAKVTWGHIEPIVVQYVAEPTEKMQRACVAVANAPGRIRQVVERLKLASRMAASVKAPLDESWFFKAIKLREKLSQDNPENAGRKALK